MAVRRLLSFFLALALLLQAAWVTGAESTRPAEPINLATLGKIGLVTGQAEPTYDFDSIVEGKGQGAGGGALRGAGSCAQLIDSGDSSGFSLLLAIVCLPIGALVGAVAGANSAAPAELIDDARSRAQEGIAALRLNEEVLLSGLEHAKALGFEVHALDPSAGPAKPDDAPSYASLAGTVDSVIEISVTRVDAKSSGREGVPVSFGIQAQVRIVDVRNGRVLDSYLIRRAGQTRPAEEWLADEGVTLRTELQARVRDYPVQVLEELLIYRPANPAEPAAKSKERVPGYALRAIDPPIRTKMPGFHPFKETRCGKDYVGGPTYGWLERFPLDTLKPVFRWDALPRDFDLVLGNDPGQVQDIRYDFRIFGASGVAYERFGLLEAFHALEEPLAPCDEFRWTVRARFTLDGLPRVTEWMGAYNTIGGYVDPRWIRGHPGKPRLYVFPSDPIAFYPIVQTQREDGAPCECR